MKTYVGKVKKDDRIFINVGGETVLEIHVKNIGKQSGRIAFIRHDACELKHIKSEKQA